MRESVFGSKFQNVKSLIFTWRNELEIIEKICLSFGMSFLIGLSAQLRIFLPWTPVPLTFQTFAILMTGVLLGGLYGGFSILIYLSLGMIGLPFFAGVSGGFGAFLGPTGGYLIGFILSACFVGYVFDKYYSKMNFKKIFLLMLFANFVFIHIPGIIHLNVYLKMINGSSPGIVQLLSMGIIPFIPGDIIKIIAASTITSFITPGSQFKYD